MTSAGHKTAHALSESGCKVIGEIGDGGIGRRGRDGIGARGIGGERGGVGRGGHGRRAMRFCVREAWEGKTESRSTRIGAAVSVEVSARSMRSGDAEVAGARGRFAVAREA